MDSEITLPNGIKATSLEINSQFKNIDMQKLLDSVPPVHYNFQPKLIPKTENPMIEEQKIKW